MDITTLKNGIQNTIKTNGAQQITGQVLQNQLLNICDTLNGGKQDNISAGNGIIVSNNTISAQIVDNLLSTDSNKSLSANMGKTLDERISAIGARGRYLSNWNCTTGQPTTQPSSLPYSYARGDYYIVSVVGDTNYIPTGSQYTGSASTTTTEEEMGVNDTFLYDGTTWIIQHNSQQSVTFGSITGNISDNAALTGAFNSKQDTLTAGENITITNNTISSSYVDTKPFIVNISGSPKVVDKTFAQIKGALDSGNIVIGKEDTYIFNISLASDNIIYFTSLFSKSIVQYYMEPGSQRVFPTSSGDIKFVVYVDENDSYASVYYSATKENNVCLWDSTNKRNYTLTYAGVDKCTLTCVDSNIVYYKEVSNANVWSSYSLKVGGSKVNTINPSAAIVSNIYPNNTYSIDYAGFEGSVSAISFIASSEDNLTNNYEFLVKVPSSVSATITFGVDGATILWANDEELSIESGYLYNIVLTKIGTDLLGYFTKFSLA